jgi:hypothetical protein
MMIGALTPVRSVSSSLLDGSSRLGSPFDQAPAKYPTDKDAMAKTAYVVTGDTCQQLFRDVNEQNMTLNLRRMALREANR